MTRARVPAPRIGFGTRLGLVGIAFTLLSFALPLLAPNLPRELLWACAAAGVGTLLAAIGAGWRRRMSSSPARLVAEDCRRVESVIGDLVQKHLPRRHRDRHRMLSRANMRASGGEDTIVALYQREHRTWALSVFDEAAGLGAVTPASRIQVEGHSAAHIVMLPALFAGAAGRLEQVSPAQGT